MSIIIKGVVQSGGKIGREIGFPTANIPLDNIIKIDRGVYVVEFNVDGYTYQGVANIGVHPTLGAISQPVLEVNIFDYSGDLYGKTVSVYLLEHMRKEYQFGSKEELVEAIKNDVSKARKYFEKR